MEFFCGNSLCVKAVIMFDGRPENVSLRHSIKFITRRFLKYSFNVLPGSKNNRVYSMSHNFQRDIPRTS